MTGVQTCALPILSLLELSNEHSEKELEQAIVSKIPIFLREFGGSCSFIGNQYRIEVNDKEYFIDILLYHRPLKCLIAIELKIGEFAPEYIGKMQVYLALMDDKVRLPDENPSIGIIMCKLKDKTIVEYALKESKKPIGVASYKIVSSPPQELKHQLPTPEQISNLLENISSSNEENTKNKKLLHKDKPTYLKQSKSKKSSKK